ncbi:MAG: L,D-transpeptidase family protein, partial [Pseudomonadota bacterium]
MMFFRKVVSMAFAVSLSVGTISAATGASGRPLVTPFQQAVAQAVSGDEAIAAFYRGRGFAPIWMGEGAAERRAAFLWALDRAGDHGLPVARYNAETIRSEFALAGDAAARGALEVEMTRRFLRYAQDVSSGVLDPRSVDRGIVLDVVRRDPLEIVTAFAEGDPMDLVQGLWPRTLGYTRLLREKLRLEEVARAGGWGAAVPGGTLEPGDTGTAVIALRDRLMRMGYLGRTATARYNGEMVEAVRKAQADHGLTADGVAGATTLAAINVSLADRLAQVVVGLERQRWMNKPLEDRHILVNLAEQHAYVVDDGVVTFDTVVVVGAEASDRRTPEFSHTMTHMVINPYWHVPRSIAVKEYLPALRRGGARHLEVHSNRGRVDRRRINFGRYNARNFPFRLKQPPGPRNALGRVKFMFPNQYNIYLHDTPAKNLFGREVRAYSHGCIRLA